MQHQKSLRKGRRGRFAPYPQRERNRGISCNLARYMEFLTPHLPTEATAAGENDEAMDIDEVLSFLPGHMEFLRPHLPTEAADTGEIDEAMDIDEVLSFLPGHMEFLRPHLPTEAADADEIDEAMDIDEEPSFIPFTPLLAVHIEFLRPHLPNEAAVMRVNENHITGIDIGIVNIFQSVRRYMPDMTEIEKLLCYIRVLQGIHEIADRRHNVRRCQ